MRRELKLDNLSKMLGKAVSGLKGQDAKAERELRPAVVEAITQYVDDRYELGKSLAQYRTALKQDRVWGKVCDALASAMGMDERTVRRIITDYEQAERASETIRSAMKAEGISLADAKNRELLEHVIELTPKDHEPTVEEARHLVGQALREFKKAPTSEPRDPRDNYDLLTPEERRFFELRMMLRRGLNDYATAEKQKQLWDAIAQEAFNVWGIKKPFTITIKPNAGPFTVDGRKKAITIAKDSVA